MKDDPLRAQLRELLRALPPATPSPGFTARVVARAGAAARDSATAQPTTGINLLGARWATLLVITTLGAVGALATGWWRWERVVAPRREREVRIEALRREHQAAAAELDRVKRLATDGEVVLYVAGSGVLDAVLELPAASPLPAHPFTSDLAVEPARVVRP